MTCHACLLQASVIEARMDKGMGPVATVIVDSGTLAVGVCVAVGTEWGKVRCLLTAQGCMLTKVLDARRAKRAPANDLMDRRG